MLITSSKNNDNNDKNKNKPENARGEGNLGGAEWEISLFRMRGQPCRSIAEGRGAGCGPGGGGGGGHGCGGGKGLGAELFGLTALANF